MPYNINQQFHGLCSLHLQISDNTLPYTTSDGFLHLPVLYTVDRTQQVTELQISAGWKPIKNLSGE